jgi:hypothetical protein
MTRLQVQNLNVKRIVWGQGTVKTTHVISQNHKNLKVTLLLL